jgi:CubicO group peptidase (beta-lactamase class C family)
MATETVETREKLTDPRVEAALSRALQGGEVGLQVAAYLHGEPIIDTWGGVIEPGGDTLVVSDTLFNIFSVTKVLAVSGLHLQVERGLVEYDAPVVRYWPEFGAHGKERATVRDIITHRAGVPQMPADITPEKLGDWDWIVQRLADTEPLVEPGTKNTYHSYTFGWLVGEIIRRSDPRHRSVGDFLREEICAPLGIESFYVGLPASEEHRVAPLTYPVRPTPPAEGDPRWLAAPKQVNFVPEIYNRSDVRAACILGAGGIADARSVASFFSLLAGRGQTNGVRLLSEDRVLSFLAPRPDHDSIDFIFSGVMLVGMGGIMVHPRGVVSAREGERILCGVGAGSSIGWADVDTGLSFAMCHNRMVVNPVMAATQKSDAPDPPFAELGDVLREIAAERS